MTAQADPYVRVYYRIIDDPKFAGVYDNDAALAAWLRLLLAADAMYPAPAHLPRGVRKAALQKLVEAEIIDLLPGDRFRLHGLTNERERRSDRARELARKRWEKDGPPDAHAMRTHSQRNAAPHSGPALHSEPSQAEPIRSEPSQAEPARLAGHELPSADDSATIACRQLFDSGKWLGDREYVGAWEDMDRRYSPEWVQAEIPPAFAACLEKRGKVLPWDLKRMTESLLAERARSEERERERAQTKAEQRRMASTSVDQTPEERERQSLIRRAVGVWIRGGRKGKVPEQVDELREWLAANEQQGAPA